MKIIIAKATALSLALGIMLNTGLFAQNSPTTTESTPSTATSKEAPSKQAEPKKAGEPATHKAMTKDDYMKRYNEMKPKLDELSSNAKVEAKNPDYNAQVTKLNQMSAEFKTKLDTWDKITPDKRAAYENELQAAHKALREQYVKIKFRRSKVKKDFAFRIELGTRQLVSECNRAIC